MKTDNRIVQGMDDSKPISFASRKDRFRAKALKGIGSKKRDQSSLRSNFQDSQVDIETPFNRLREFKLYKDNNVSSDDPKNEKPDYFDHLQALY